MLDFYVYILWWLCLINTCRKMFYDPNHLLYMQKDVDAVNLQDKENSMKAPTTAGVKKNYARKRKNK